MTRALAIMLALALTICFVGADTPPPQLVIPVSVVSVGDGDTVTVDITIRANVRLLDCWAPETNKPNEKVRGLKSKARLESLARGKKALLTVPLGDNLGRSLSLGRVLGKLSIDGKDISEQMVKEGYATKTKPKK